MSSALVATGEFAGLVIAIGTIGAAIPKGVGMMRKFSHFLDQWFGSPETPGIVDRLKRLEAILTKHIDLEVPKWMADGTAWGNRLDADIQELKARVSALEQSEPPDPLTR